jgi:iron complex transport system ATP-binding protein
MDAYVLEIVDATVVKGGRRVLDRVSIAIPSGAHTAILGPNGAGKSTLLNLLTHDDRPFIDRESDGGSPMVRVFGRDRWNVAELRTRLGVVSADLHQRFVNGNSAGRISAEDAVLSGLFAGYGVVRLDEVTSALQARAREALARMGVEHLAATTLDRMSTGEARRVLIARALVTRPSALVLDEPTTGLDLVARSRSLDAIRQLARNGVTIVLITHRVEEVIPEVSRVVLLRNGAVAAAGPKGEVLTSANLSLVFDASVALHERGGFYTAAVASDDVAARR